MLDSKYRMEHNQCAFLTKFYKFLTFDIQKYAKIKWSSIDGHNLEFDM